MALGVMFFVVAVAVIAIWILIEAKRMKHKIFAIFLIALILFFIALADYCGYFIVMCHKIKNNNLDTTKNEAGLNEAHLNSSLMGLQILVSKQKLLPPANKSE